MNRYERIYPHTDIVLFEPDRRDPEIYLANTFSYTGIHGNICLGHPCLFHTVFQYLQGNGYIGNRFTNSFTNHTGDFVEGIGLVACYFIYFICMGSRCSCYIGQRLGHIGP